ncbi:MAG: FAD-dependent oxidoreductase [Proteobacteria bacterium]|nr:FAD-dependent oxidoreductase [Burkholderiales bacterium]
MQQTSIAIVGSGISGLAAAWLLRARYRVTVFEAGAYAGGHTNTVDVELDGVRAPVDTGFLVFNERTYPNLIALFDHLGVASVTSEMSFSVRMEDERLEWAGTSIGALFAQKRNLVNPRFWRMLGDIRRFNRSAPALLERADAAHYSLGEFLAEERYSREFCDWYLLPMAAAIWSCPMHAMREFPAASFVRFFVNHGLLQITRRPRWMTVVGGGREYVRRLLDGLDDVRLASPVTAVRRLPQSVEVVSGGRVEQFDQIILAAHADQSLALLDDADARERALLGAVCYQPNAAWLHTDREFLPVSPRAWAAWNYTGRSASSNAGTGAAAANEADATAAGSVSVTYLINKLQPLPMSTPVLVTLNPHRPIASDKVIRQIAYAHPVFDAAALAAQQRLSTIQGVRRTWFCGAWTGYGFHEDGLKSAMAVSESLGVRAPWVDAGAPVAAEVAMQPPPSGPRLVRAA